MTNASSTTNTRFSNPRFYDFIEYFKGSKYPGEVKPVGRQVKTQITRDRETGWEYTLIHKFPENGKKEDIHIQVRPTIKYGSIAFHHNIKKEDRGRGILEILNNGWKEKRGRITFSEARRYYKAPVDIWVDWAKDEWGEPRRTRNFSEDDEYYGESASATILTPQGYIEIPQEVFEGYTNGYREKAGFYKNCRDIEILNFFCNYKSALAHFILYCRSRGCKQADLKEFGKMFSDSSADLTEKAKTVKEDFDRFDKEGGWRL